MNKVAVIGLGYVGLPLLKLLRNSKYDAIGIEIDNEKVEKIRITDNLLVTSYFSKIRKCNIIVICVPTPTKEEKIEIKYFKQAIYDIGKYINNKALIINESTIGIGMTQSYVSKILKDEYDKELNIDYYLAYCPERIDPVNKKYNIKNINRVCGASSDYALEIAYKFYNSIINAKIKKMKSIKECELIKCWENSTRNISIAESNLLAKICDEYKFDIKDIIDGLNTKVEQFGLNIAYPGLGPGGHCIPEDIQYLITSVENNTDIDMSLFKESVKINENMPNFIENKIEKLIEKEKKNKKLNLLFLGVSYKPNSDDIRHSQAIKLLKMLEQNNKLQVKYYDPIAKYTANNEIKENELQNELCKTDIIVLGCPHKIFNNIDYTKYKKIKYIIDCWNSINEKYIDELKINYIGVGR